MRALLRWIARGAAVAVTALALACPVRAESPADVTNPRTARGGWTSDMAGILSGPAVATLDRIAGELERTNGAEIAVVTVHDAGELTPKEFATALFNRWGIGKRGRDDGVLMLVVVSARRVEVETGYGAESVLPDARVGRILRRFVLPRFRAGEWDSGVIAGTTEIARVLASGTPEEPIRARSPWPLALGFGSGTMGLLGLGALARWRSRIRHCPRCRRRMRLLDEEQDDAYLDPAGKLEEELRSVDHRVWRCDDCRVQRLEQRLNWFSGYGKCPKCGHRTLSTTSHVVSEATSISAGRQEVTQVCRLASCGHRLVHQQTIPVLTDPDSDSGSSGGGGSGGGSFGGGSSGGGGAGGSW